VIGFLKALIAFGKSLISVLDEDSLLISAELF
jgi:hypothetical protein